MNNNKYQIWITSKHKLFDLNINEIFQYRDLLIMFVKRNFITKYKQTILGPFWAIIQPLLSTIVHTLVFVNMAKLPVMDIAGDYILPGIVFQMSGEICWYYFNMTLHSTSATFLSNASLMGKVYYPRIITPIATALSTLISFGIQFVMFVVFITFYVIKGGTSISLSPMILLIPLSILQMFFLSIGCGIIVSSVTTKYRDLQKLVAFGTELWKYATPIVYGLQLVPQKWFGFYMLNPMASVVTTFRYGMFGFGYFNIGYYVWSWFVTIAVFFIGVMMFNKIERTFVDTI